MLFGQIFLLEFCSGSKPFILAGVVPGFWSEGWDVA